MHVLKTIVSGALSLTLIVGLAPVATIAALAKEVPIEVQSELNIPFIDVTEETAHVEDICWLYDTEISQGWVTAQGREFRPYANVARADMAAFLHRVFGKAFSEDGGELEFLADATGFTDVTTDTAHYEDIQWLYDTEISQGWVTAQGREFRPYANVARADMAAFLHRLDALV